MGRSVPALSLALEFNREVEQCLNLVGLQVEQLDEMVGEHGQGLRSAAPSLGFAAWVLGLDHEPNS